MTNGWESYIGDIMNQRRWGSACRKARAFTLVELLTVIAIISLLIGILVPAISRARIQAKKGATQAILKAISDGMDLFRNENPEECRSGEGYPSSLYRDDPTEEEEQKLCGAQWAVRYLMGKTQDGYIPRRNVPRSVPKDAPKYYEQGEWYVAPAGTSVDDPRYPIARVGPYLPQDRVSMKKPSELTGFAAMKALGAPFTDDNLAMKQPVFLDAFDNPILYYAANTAMYKRLRTTAPLAGCDDSTDPNRPTDQVGIYTHSDNWIFTGMDGCGGTPTPPWPLEGAGVITPGQDLVHFGTWTNNLPLNPLEFLNPPANQYTFPGYILNKTIFESTEKDPNGLDATVAPYRPDSFILISAGVDGIYGSEDDVNNFSN
jgi:prepilin-type N-terminal cleavage/methylation domain-containing protein